MGSNKARDPQGPSLCPHSRTPGGTFALFSHGELMQAGPTALALGPPQRWDENQAGARGRLQV